jgi:hypothetical protein
MFTIGVWYCGGCNPQIDRSRIVMELREGLRKMGLKVDFTSVRKSPVDMVLLVNGCKHACLEAKSLKAGRDRPKISVRGEMVEDQYVGEGDLPRILIQRIGSFL